MSGLLDPLLTKSTCSPTEIRTSEGSTNPFSVIVIVVTIATLEQGYGFCWDRSDVFITICRAAGIPARQVLGWVPTMNAVHVWCEVHIDGEGWLPVDATAPWLGVSADYLPFFLSEEGDLQIFYGSWPQIVDVK